MTDMPDSNNHSLLDQASKALAKLSAIDKRGVALAHQRAEFIRGLPIVVREALAVCGHLSVAEADLPKAST